VIVGGIAVGLLGFALGLFSFKVKSRWCPKCGAWTHRERPAYDWASAPPAQH